MYGHRIFPAGSPALLAILLIATGHAGAETLISNWSPSSHRVSAEFDTYWQQPRNALRLDHGWLLAKNDQDHLYLLVDLTGDTGEDRPGKEAPWGDYLSLAFDLDLDGRISPDGDIAFSQYPGSYRLGRQTFKGPGRFSGLNESAAVLVSRFGPSPALQQRHRIWELSLPLRELKTRPGGKLRLGLLNHSDSPSFTDRLPANHTSDFNHLVELTLASSPTGHLVTRIDTQTMRRMLSGRRIVVRPDLTKLKPAGQPGGLAQGLPQGCDFPQGEPEKRIITADGTVELIYPNGSRKQYVNGGWKLFCPDGTQIPVMVLKSTQIQPTLPPTLPDQDTLQWLDFHNTGLLGIISQLVDDQAMVEHYLDTENSGWNVYEQIANRLKTIDYLLAE